MSAAYFVINGSVLEADTITHAAARYVCQRPWMMDERSGRVGQHNGVLYAYPLTKTGGQVETFDLAGCRLKCDNLPHCLSDLSCPYSPMPVR